jgi:cytochrome c oxidase subunit II
MKKGSNRRSGGAVYRSGKHLSRLGALIAAGLLLAGCSGNALGRQVGLFSSNGERIYFTASSARGAPVTYALSPGFGGGMMGGGMMGRLACANCHGPDGRGGQVQMGMYSFTAPDIRYTTLTAPMSHDAGESHPPYTDATIRRAITEGVDPAGEPLKAPMPRWQMSAGDLDDLVAFLKTLN